MGLNEPGPRGFDDVSEMLDLNPQLRTHVAYHTESDSIPVARANGITTVAVVPGGGTFGGEVAVMNLDGWTWEEATLKPNVGITFNFPALGGGGGRGGGGGGGGRGQAPRRRSDVRGHQARTRSAARRADPALRPGARLREGRPEQDHRLDARSAGARRRAAAAAHHEREPRSGHQRRHRVCRPREGQHRHQRRRSRPTWWRRS